VSSDYVLQANVKVGQHLINVTGSDTETFKANLQWTTENAAGIVAAAVALEAAYQVGPLAQNTASVQVQQQATAALRTGRSGTSTDLPAAAARTRRSTRAILPARPHEACAWWHQQVHRQGVQLILCVHG